MLPAFAGNMGNIIGMSVAGTLGYTLGPIAAISAISFACRCGARGTMSKEHFNGNCPKCGKNLRKMDTRPTTIHAPPPPPETALHILDVRLAKGEVQVEEYQKIRTILLANQPVPEPSKQ